MTMNNTDRWQHVYNEIVLLMKLLKKIEQVTKCLLFLFNFCLHFCLAIGKEVEFLVEISIKTSLVQ